MAAAMVSFSTGLEVWVLHFGGQDGVAWSLGDVGGQQMVACLGRPSDAQP